MQVIPTFLNPSSARTPVSSDRDGDSPPARLHLPAGRTKKGGAFSGPASIAAPTRLIYLLSLLLLAKASSDIPEDRSKMVVGSVRVYC